MTTSIGSTMEGNPICGCKGIRRCLHCEEDNPVPDDKDSTGIPSLPVQHYCFCPDCKSLYSSKSDVLEECSEHDQVPLSLESITVLENFLSADEEASIVREINRYPWKLSQSGRMKQDFGPKVNFKRKKVSIAAFDGLPQFSDALYSKMTKSVVELDGFHPVEVCNLLYSPERGASIDAHIDDRWLWGERLVTLSLLSDSLLTLTHPDKPALEVLVPMPARSLLVLSDAARHEWRHAVKRRHITDDRIAVTLRELSLEFGVGGDNEETGATLLKIASNFNGQPLYKQ